MCIRDRREILARSDMRQLAQRITARYHLMPLDASETGAYLRHRFRIAGGLHSPFNANAVVRVHKHSGGVPRLINVIAERALLGGYAHDTTKIEASDIDRAAKEALAPNKAKQPHPMRWAAAAVVVLAAIGGWFLWPRTPPADVQAKPVASKPVEKAAPSIAKLDAKPAAVPVLTADALPARLQGADANGAPAWAALLKLWNSGADATVAATCPPAIEAGLYCLRGNATLDKLFAQGRPALLRLRAANGATSWALLLGADAMRVRLRLGDDTVDLDRLALQQAWNGEYIALWRGPDTLAEAPTADGRGPAVDWVHARLDPKYTGPAVLDAAMRDSVRAFQQARGLATDGVIGPETLLALASREPGPRLRTHLE